MNESEVKVPRMTSEEKEEEKRHFSRLATLRSAF